MDKILEQSLLYDFYGELLTEHQKRIYEDFVLNDLSLGEIASDQGVSRQAVHDIIKRCNKQLTLYEEKLQLIQRFAHTKGKIAAVLTKTQGLQQKAPSDMAQDLKEVTGLCQEILEEL